LKDQYLLNKDITFLNHGSFGACPRPVFKDYQRWQNLLEEQPVQFMSHDIYRYLEQARNKLGSFVGCKGDDLFFVPNPTIAINTVIRSLNLEPGFEVLSSDHEYGSLIRAWEWFSDEKGYIFVKKALPVPMTSHQDFVDNFWEGVTTKTKIIFLSHITSSTGLIFPVQDICKRARLEGIITIIDGAHVPGHIKLNIELINPDIYTGACHKWLSAPKGSTFLYVQRKLQEFISPLIVSWGNVVDPSPFQFINENQYQGTRDPSSFLAVPAAIKFQHDNDWESVQLRCRNLARQTRDHLYMIMDTEPICPNTEEWLAQMASIEIPINDIISFKNKLLSDYNIEIPIFEWKDRNLLRLSFNAYNDEKDAERLIDAIKELL
jgi:isopenicillin-N epimerase